MLITLMKDLGGKMVGFIEIAEDVTKRKKAEERLKSELESALKGQQSLTGWQEGSITAGLAGVGPLRERSPAVFSKIRKSYESLLEAYLDALGFSERPPRKEIGDLAEMIGRAGGGPRDVVDMHIRAVEEKSRRVSTGRAQAYAVEGRLLALEVMGNLVDYYRIGMKH